MTTDEGTRCRCGVELSKVMRPKRYILTTGPRIGYAISP